MRSPGAYSVPLSGGVGTTGASVSPSGPVSAERSDLWPPATLAIKSAGTEMEQKGNWGGGRGCGVVSRVPPMPGGVGGRIWISPEPQWPGKFYPSPRSCQNQPGGLIHSTSLDFAAPWPLDTGRVHRFNPPLES